jgi:hypothetical protein
VAFPSLVGSASGLKAFQTLYFLTRWVIIAVQQRQQRCRPSGWAVECYCSIWQGEGCTMQSLVLQLVTWLGTHLHTQTSAAFWCTCEHTIH